MLRLSRSNIDPSCKGTRNEGGANARLYVAETKTYFASLADFYSGTPMEKAFTESALFAQGTPTIQQEVLDKIRTIVDVTVRNQELLDRDGKLTRALSRPTASTFITFLSVSTKDNIEIRNGYKTAGFEYWRTIENPKTGKGKNSLSTGSFGIECLFLVTEGGVTVHHRDPLWLGACRPRPLTPPRPPPRYSPAGSLLF